MSSIPNGQKDEWSSASQELFRAARSDHAPTSTDRERVRRALAQRIAVGPGASGASGIGGMAGHAASALSRLLKLGLGLSLVVVATIAVRRAQEEPAHSVQSSGVQVSSGVSSAASNETSTVAQGDATRSAEPVQQHGDDAAELAVQARAADSAAQGRSRASGRGAGSQRDGASQARDDSSVRGHRAHARAAQASVGATTRASLPPAAAVEDDAQLARASRGTEAARAGVPASAAVDDNSQAASSPGTGATRAGAPVKQVETAADERVALQRAEQAGDERSARPAKVEAPEDGPAEDARAELAFVRKMQAALRAGEVEDVLELCAEHAERWPHGTFVQEREGLRAIASCNTSAQNADARAKAFLTKYPRTPLGPRVREACKLQLKAAGGAASKTAR